MFKKQNDNSSDVGDFVEQLMENGNIKRYLKGRILGKGGFAQCYEFVSQETGKRYAAKVIDKQSLTKGKAKQKLQSQIMIHKSLRHRNIVKFQHFFEDNQFVYILLELCSNNTLNELLKRRKVLTQVQVKYYIIQIIKAVDYIHKHKVIHRDLKLGNFFLSDQLELKVGDFGLATMLTHQNQKRKTVCGTPNYIAPQILEGKKGHSYQVDVWSLGAITYALLFGKPPFETSEVNSTYEKIKKCDYNFPKSNVTQSAKHFVSKMLKLLPSDRATIDQLLNEEFLNCQNIPHNLPFSTLACPPSKAFLESIKSNHYLQSQPKSQQNQLQLNLNSSRTSKQNASNKFLNASEKPQSYRNNTKSRKSQRSIGSLARTTSTALMVVRKKVNSHLQQSKNSSKIWISHFEQQPKYGLFYKLSSGAIGMRFNDITCLVSNKSFNRFRYVVLKNNRQSQVEIFELGQQREILEKKMKIIHHFKKQLKVKEDQHTSKQKQDNFPSSVYVVAHFNTTHFILFWLSNSTYQARFKDETELLVETQLYTFISKDKKRYFVKSNFVYEANEEIKSKINHANSMIRKLKTKKLTNNQEKRQSKEKGACKQNHTLPQSISSKLIKPKQAIKRQFSSTSNLQIKRPLSQFVSNK